MTSRADTRTQILDAAESLFALYGYRGTSTRSIAESAGLTQPVINYHFDSKAALFEEALGRSIDRLVSSLGPVLEDLRSGDTGVAGAFREICERVFEAPTTNRMIRSLSAHDDDELGLESRIKAATTLRQIAGAVGGEDTKTVATVFMTLSSLSDLSAMTQAQRFTYGIDPHDLIEVGVAAVVDGARAAPVD